MKQPFQPLTAGSRHAKAAWLFLIAAMISGLLGVYRMMSADAVGTAVSAGALHPGTDCMCLGVLLAVIAAALALLGIHRQVTAVYDLIGPGYQGSNGSGSDV